MSKHAELLKDARERADALEGELIAATARCKVGALLLRTLADIVEANNEAVEVERKQCAERLRQLGTGDPSTFIPISRTEAIDAILRAHPEPRPAEEPMTIAKVMDWFHETGCGELELSQVEKKLIALLQAQARRDANFIRSELKDSTGCMIPNSGWVADKLLESAGLK